MSCGFDYLIEFLLKVKPIKAFIDRTNKYTEMENEKTMRQIFGHNPNDVEAIPISGKNPDHQLYLLP